MAQSTTRCANISSSKRSFEDTAFLPRPSCSVQYHLAHYAVASTELDHHHHRHNLSSPYPPSKRRSSLTQHINMLAERTTIMSGSFPSFMSVFGSEETGLFRPGDLDDQTKHDENAFPLMTAQSTITQAPPPPHSKPHQHRGSLNSLFSASTESSPTTTNSTFDSPLVSDTSASSSPESATSMAPSGPFRLPTQPLPILADDKPPIPSMPQAQTQTHTKMTQDDTTKNVKKLTLDMNIPSILRPATANPALESSHPLSAPTSPLKEPMRSARKKPTNLTIRTPGYNQLTFPRAAGNVPATPGQRPALHHMQSSPSLPSLASPRGPPAGGMFLALPSLSTPCANQCPPSSNSSSFLANSMPDLREEGENAVPKSQEAPERGYTEGPVCVYDCGVYLYLEPTAAEASNFDTVINVAKEIRNPFKSQKAGEGTVMSVWRADPQVRDLVKEPQTAISEYSFKSAWEYPPESTITPTAATPTQSLFAQQPKVPEYVHVRWDHNSEILDDLFPLCQIIDSRIAQGKKVLVHCQLGVSRSASLIIAYGLYKNYRQNFHAMYTAVKERSRWVGPNMSLIYQLTDFKNKLNRGTITVKEPHPDWFVPSPDGPTTPTVSAAATDPNPATTPPREKADIIMGEAVSEEKRVTPLRLNKALPPVPLFPKEFKPAPAPEPSTTPQMAPAPPQKSSTTVKRPASKPLPFREKFAEMRIPAHAPRLLPGITVPRSPSALMDLAMKDVPSTPSIFSPRVTEFTATPFGIRGAGDLSTPGNRQSKEIPANFNWLPLRKDGHQRTASKDPRSPHQHSESKEIFRSIDNYL